MKHAGKRLKLNGVAATEYSEQSAASCKKVSNSIAIAVLIEGYANTPVAIFPSVHKL